MLNFKAGMAGDLDASDRAVSKQLTLRTQPPPFIKTVLNLLLWIYSWVGYLYAGRIFLCVVRVLLSRHVKWPFG